MVKILLENFKGGINLEDLGDKTAISEDHTLTWKNMLNLTAVGVVQNAYQTLQSNNVFENKDFLATDEFIDTNGTNNTVNVDDTTSLFNTNYYGALSKGSSLGEDTADYSTTSSSYVTLVSKTSIDSTMSGAEIKTQASINREYRFRVIFNYDDATSENSDELIVTSTEVSLRTTFMENPNLLKTVSSIDIQAREDSTSETPTVFLRNLEWFSLSLTGVVVCDTNIKTLDGTEESICIYTDKTLPVDTSMTVDITDGTTTLSSQNFDEVIGLNGFTSGNLKLTFNISTTDINVNPAFYGYGVLIK